MIEISPASMKLMSEMCDLLVSGDGVSLIVDYGEDQALSNSIRGIKNHKLLGEE